MPQPANGKGEEAADTAAAHDPPTIVSSADRPARDGKVGGRLLTVKGTDGPGRSFETEVLVIRDDDGLTAQHAVYWSGDKFEEDETRSRADAG